MGGGAVAPAMPEELATSVTALATDTPGVPIRPALASASATLAALPANPSNPESRAISAAPVLAAVTEPKSDNQAARPVVLTTPAVSRAAKAFDVAGTDAAGPSKAQLSGTLPAQPLLSTAAEQVGSAALAGVASAVLGSAGTRHAPRSDALAGGFQPPADPATAGTVAARAVEAVPAAAKLLAMASAPATPIKARDSDQAIDPLQAMAFSAPIPMSTATATETSAAVAPAPAEAAAQAAHTAVAPGRLQLQMQNAEMGSMNLDMALDASGHAHLIVHAATESLAMSLGERTGQLVDAMRDLGLTVQVDVRQGGSQAGGGAAGQRPQPDAAATSLAEPRALPMPAAVPRRAPPATGGSLNLYA